MRKPNLKEFYDDSTDTYDFEEYASVMGDYEDEKRDEELERQWDIGDQIHEARKDEKDERLWMTQLKT